MRAPRALFSISSLLTIALATSACAQPNVDTPPVMPATDDGPATERGLADILLASNLPGTLDQAQAGDNMAVTVHRLSNGMTVYISTDRQKPRVSAWIAVRTGSRNDPANSTGLAHYLEHMLFKGTDELGTMNYEAETPSLERTAKLYDELREAETPEARAKIFAEIDKQTQESAKHAVPNEISRLYGAMGIEGLNAFTSFDQTVYVADVPVNRFEAWTQVEIERFADPAFRLFYPELEAVYEEKNRSIDSPFRNVWQAMLSGMWTQHPYGTQTTIGEVEHLKVPAYGDMVEYFHKWYVPNNMAIVLAGDIDAETALPLLEKSLGQLPAKDLGTPSLGKLSGPKGRVFAEVIAEGEQGVSIAWPTVAAAHADRPALEVMDMLVDNARTGLLNIELELSQKVPDAGSSHNTMHEAGYWSMRATAKEGQSLEEVEQLLLGVVTKLKAGEFEQADIDAIILNGDLAEKTRLEFAQARVSKMADAYVNRMEWTEVLARDEAKRKVTKEEILRVAAKYIGEDMVVVYRKRGKPDLPKIEKPTITPVDIDNSRRSPFADHILAMKSTPLEPDWLVEGEHYKVSELPAGRLIAAHNDANDLFQLIYSFDRGSRQSRTLCLALDLLERSGTADQDAESLQKALYSLGSTISFRCGADSSSINVAGLDAKMEETLVLLDTWISKAKFEQDTLDKMVENKISERSDQIEDPRYLGRALTAYAQLGKDSRYLAEPSNRDLKRAKARSLAKLVAKAPNFQHRTMYYGPRSAEDAAKAVALGEKHKRVAEPKARRYRKQKGMQIYFLPRDVAKSSVSMVMPLGVLGDEDRARARLLQEYFGGGMASIIFQEIREARGLAYFARGGVRTGSRPTDDWAFSGMMDTQSNKTIDALSFFLELVRERPLDSSRTDEAKVSLEEEYRSSRVEPRFIVYMVDRWFDRGDDKDPRPAEREGAVATDNTRLQDFANMVTEAPVIISILGNESEIDMKALGGIAKVREVKPAQLFSW